MLFLYKFLFKHSKNKQKFFSQICPKRYYPEFLKMMYSSIMHKDLNLDTPVTLSEKIQWLKLKESTKLKGYVADKSTFKDWLKQKLGCEDFEYCAKTIQICEKFEQIDFTKLPKNGFVVKVNNNFKKNFFSYDTEITLKHNLTNLKVLTKKWLKDKHAFNSFELHYAHIKPKLIVEELICKRNDENSKIYQIYCFNGIPKLIEHTRLVGNHISGYYSQSAVYDINWNKLPCNWNLPKIEEVLPPPRQVKQNA